MLQIKDNTIFDWPVVLFVDAYGGVVAALDGGFSQSMKKFCAEKGGYHPFFCCEGAA